jgi:hypothetical protein
MGKCKIVCSLDDEESAAKLYGEYANLGKRSFSHARYAEQVEEYLIERAQQIFWNSESPVSLTVKIERVRNIPI